MYLILKVSVSEFQRYRYIW